MPNKSWNKYPVSLGRVAVFLPCKRKMIQETVIETGWGKVKITGAPLTTYDEDIFLVLINKGKKKMFSAADGDVFETIVFEGSLYEIAKESLKKRGSKTYEQIRNSISHLHSVTIHISCDGITIHDSIIYQSILDNHHAHKPLKVVMNAKVANAFQKSRHVDIQVRKKLSPTGKALHRFLSMHGKEFSCRIEKLQKSIAPTSRRDNLLRELKNALEKLKALNFLEDYTVDEKKIRTLRMKAK
jgi:hypothetical protein